MPSTCTPRRQHRVDPYSLDHLSRNAVALNLRFNYKYETCSPCVAFYRHTSLQIKLHPRTDRWTDRQIMSTLQLLEGLKQPHPLDWKKKSSEQYIYKGIQSLQTAYPTMTKQKHVLYTHVYVCKIHQFKLQFRTKTEELFVELKSNYERQRTLLVKLAEQQSRTLLGYGFKHHFNRNALHRKTFQKDNSIVPQLHRSDSQ